ncbi:hypothetical protein ABFY09_06415 [Marinomonas sp. 5E14-1]|uniref:hypothetical protein n=1 Tax=Marinomonas sp. 5E14-1 TaxID=3153922 RepID=UPI003264CA32
MPSSNPLQENNVTAPKKLEIEVVSPSDGRGETYCFLSVCIGTICIAFGLLSILHEPSQVTLSELPNTHSNLATQISNALEEITLLDEMGMISTPYDLQQLPLPQSGTASFTQQNEYCFTLLHKGILFSVEHEQESWQAHWAPSDTINDCHATLKWHELNR